MPDYRWCDYKSQQGSGYLPILYKVFSLETKNIYADVKARKDYRQNVVWLLLDYRDVPFSNNLTENAIRHCVVGKKLAVLRQC